MKIRENSSQHQNSGFCGQFLSNVLELCGGKTPLHLFVFDTAAVAYYLLSHHKLKTNNIKQQRTFGQQAAGSLAVKQPLHRHHPPTLENTSENLLATGLGDNGVSSHAAISKIGPDRFFFCDWKTRTSGKSIESIQHTIYSKPRLTPQAESFLAPKALSLCPTITLNVRKCGGEMTCVTLESHAAPLWTAMPRDRAALNRRSLSSRSNPGMSGLNPDRQRHVPDAAGAVSSRGNGEYRRKTSGDLRSAAAVIATGTGLRAAAAVVGGTGTGLHAAAAAVVEIGTGLRAAAVVVGSGEGRRWARNPAGDSRPSACVSAANAVVGDGPCNGER